MCLKILYTPSDDRKQATFTVTFPSTKTTIFGQSPHTDPTDSSAAPLDPDLVFVFVFVLVLVLPS
jgi:hypothetical protein